jgi:signal transduction histidine kinase
MFLFLAVLCGFSALAILFAGIFPILQSSARSENRWFFALTLVLAVWVPVNFLDSNIVRLGTTEFLVRVDYSLALVIGWLFLQFAAAFMSSESYMSKRQSVNIPLSQTINMVSGVLGLLLICGVLVNLVFIVSVDGGKLSVVSGALFYPYVIVLCGYFVSALTILGKGFLRATGSARRGLDLIVAGFVIAFTTNVLSNLIIPNIVSDRTVVKEMNIIGYVGMVVLVGCIYVAITKKKLFDIKFYVVRATAYFVTVLLIGVVYIAPAVYIMAVGIMGLPFDLTKFIVVVSFATAVAIYFDNLRAWLDNTTSKIFFRDKYDSAVVLGELNKILVSTVDLDKLLHTSSSLIAATLKAEFCVFALNETSIAGQRFIGTETKKVSVRDMHQARNVRFAPETNLVVTDYLEQEQSELKTVLTKNGIAVLIRLSSNSVDSEEGLGYILLGYKKSGNGYSAKDAQALEAMADALTIAIQNALRFEEIQNFNVTLQRRVDEATRKLVRTNAKLEALDESKDDFISMASHQLRTPLTAVKGYLSMVLEGDAGKVTPVQKQMLNEAYLSSQRMVFLIADLLNVSRLKTGKFVIERTPVNLSKLISEEMAQLRETAAAKSLKLSYDKPKEFPMLMLDETKSRQVIMNYIDNAIHYTPAGGHIRVELHDKSNSVELLVIDDGIGVPKSEQHHLFTKFYRAINARRRRPDGTGLGLFMAKKVIVAQGGAVIFESRENQGSTFGFTLPKDKLLVHQVS